MRKAVLDIEVYDLADDEWAQAKYLVHGYDDVLWTDNLESALLFLKEAVEKAEES